MPTIPPKITVLGVGATEFTNVATLEHTSDHTTLELANGATIVTTFVDRIRVRLRDAVPVGAGFGTVAGTAPDTELSVNVSVYGNTSYLLGLFAVENPDVTLIDGDTPVMSEFTLVRINDAPMFYSVI
jgi:hypothetical protein